MIGRRMLLAGLTASVMDGATAQPQLAPFPFDTVWIVETLNDERFAPVSRPTVRVTRDLRVAGTTGCNRYGGAATLGEAGRISFGQLFSTKMACFGAGGDNERMFLPAINTVTGWRMERRMLVLDTARGPLRLRRR